MRTTDITAIRWERRSIKRKAHLFSLLSVLAAVACGPYPFVSDKPLDFWFWFLMILAGVMAGVSAAFWIFERRQDTLLVGSTSDRRPHDLE